jgi:hypothetical protein
MTQEEKKLLLKDLCARLPYKVEVYYSETVPISTLKTINSEKGTCIVYDHSQWDRNSKFHIEEIKPYLRPMSSMTEKERQEYNKIMFQSERYENDYAADVDWLNAHHFDYRGLIKKGLSIEAPKGMYNIKNKAYEEY